MLKRRCILRNRRPIWPSPCSAFPLLPWARRSSGARPRCTLIFLWRPDSVDKKDLDLIPKGDAVGEKAIPVPLRDFITTRLEKQSLLWLVGDLEPLVQLQGALEPLRGVLPWLKTVPRIPEPWTSLKFAGLSVVNEMKKDETPRALTLRAQLQTPTEKIASGIEAHLKEATLPGQSSRHSDGPAPGSHRRKGRSGCYGRFVWTLKGYGNGCRGRGKNDEAALASIETSSEYFSPRKPFPGITIVTTIPFLRETVPGRVVPDDWGTHRADSLLGPIRMRVFLPEPRRHGR